MSYKTFSISFIFGIFIITSFLLYLNVDKLNVTLHQPLYEYDLNINGIDIKVIEFTPKSSPHKTCVITHRRGAIFCFDKKVAQ